MERIAIVGCSGGGKSTLARALGARLGLPVIHLDALFWQPGWKESEPEPFRAKVAQALAAPRWVVDGGFFTDVGDLTLGGADTVVWIDQPTWLCLWRAFGRALTQFGRTRADLAPGCPEKIDPAFYAYIWQYPRKTRPRLLRALAEHAPGTPLVRLRSDAQIGAWLASIGQPIGAAVR